MCFLYAFLVTQGLWHSRTGPEVPQWLQQSLVPQSSSATTACFVLDLTVFWYGKFIC